MLCKNGNVNKLLLLLFAGWEVRIVKNCDLGLENVFHYMAQPKPVNNFIFFLSLKRLCLLTGKKLMQALL